MKRVLSIGNCGYDNGSLRSLLNPLGAELAAADDWDDAQALLSQAPCSLILVNRRLDADGSDGLEIIRGIKESPDYASMPVMLLSNYPEYQTKAVQLGALPGFGKSALDAPTTLDRLQQIIG
jgi:two-component system chemotaxis response regulator CheY